MLWKKESKKPNALYVDILAASGLDLEEVTNVLSRSMESKPHPQKDDASALRNRNDGNAAFRRKAYKDAMELYNDSLRFAKPGSVHISLAYANRSACFLKMQMFEKCLNDIKLAKDAGYPEHLMPKLNQRKTECLEQLENGASSHADIGAELSFEPNKNFPCMANILKVQQGNANENGNCMVVAKQDIDVGQTIVVEDAVFPYLYKHFGLKCNICLKENENLVPCKTCAAALFCADCQGHYLHEYECGLNIFGECEVNSDYMYKVRTILLIIKAFPTVDGLMSFTERIRNNKEMPTDLTDFQSKYQVYFNSGRRDIKNTFCSNIQLLAMKIYPMFRIILQLPQIKAMFQSRKHLRFLMHLIGDCSFVAKEMIQTKTIVRSGPRSDANPNAARFASVSFDDNDDPVYDAYHPTMKYFRKSCYSNALRLANNGQTILITTRPIKQGEQVFQSCVHIDSDPNQENSASKCEWSNCTRCKGVRANPEQRHQLSSEPAFIELMENWSFSHTSEESMENCAFLLRKYGRIDWCDEIKFVLSAYHDCLYYRSDQSSIIKLKAK